MGKVEEYVANKLIDMVQFVLEKLVKPDITIDHVAQLNVDVIEELKRMYGIEAIILDVDDTIRKEGVGQIPEHNKDWVASLNGKIKVIILSNGIDREIEEYFKSQGIGYIGFACKPLKTNFRKACKQLGVTPDKVLVVGNSLFDDVHGGRRNKMKTALVRSVEERN